MKHFLRVVASAYKKRYKDLSNLTFVMPNKRSGSFLLKYFKELSEEPSLAPRIIPVSDFIDRCIQTVRDSRLDLLFRLYESYRKLQTDTDVTFERFSSWGETMLSDFNEVDLHLVDPDEVFKNVSDLNSIRSTFLSEEQKKVMRDYFGCSPDDMAGEVSRFWKEFESKDSEGNVEVKGSRKKFYTLWQLLPDIYKEFKQKLAEAGFTTEGGAYREAALRIEEGFEPFPGDKLIFVGFNALAESERRIFKALRDMKVTIEEREEPKADFLWDMLSSKIADDNDPSVKFVKVNSRKGNFPPPEWISAELERSVPDHEPDIDVIAVPSGTMQVKVVADILENWKKSTPNLEDNSVAVVLADENLLLPLLHSLPKDYNSPNLTMGFPLKHTPVISFAALLRQLHFHSRHSSGEDIFLFEDVRDLLSHPYSHILFGSDKIREYIAECEDKKRITVTGGSLAVFGENAKALFRHFPESTAPIAVIGYLRKNFKNISDAMNSDSSFLNSNIEKAYISVYNDALVRLANCIGDYDVSVSPAGVFSLSDRLMGGEKVAFEGEPLRGLQVMGLLETRCLDFERIAMLSVNEKVLPRVGRHSSFIPNVIRVAYGMPPANYQEEIFSYYFFRLLGRCSRGVLTYDSRSSETRTPGPSRYLLQMKYLPDGFKFRETETRFGMPKKFSEGISIAKDDYISGHLDMFLSNWKPSNKDDKPKNFSASALRDYMDCRLKFLYQGVLNLYVEPEKTETINPIDLGTIVHHSIEKLYIPDKGSRGKLLSKPIVLTYDALKAILNRRLPDGSSYIEEVAKREIIHVHFKVKEEDVLKEELRGSAVFLLDYIVGYIKNIIRADMSRAPFRLWGTEIKETVNYPLPDGREVNLKMVIDRLDQSGDSDPEAPFRIIDYKTGSVHLKANLFEDIFNGSYKSQNIFQLLFYAELLIYLVRKGTIKLPNNISKEDFEKNLEIAIYSVLTLPDEKGVIIPEIEKAKIGNIGLLRKFEEELGVSFKEELERILVEILDRDIPFDSVISDKQCRFCDYRLRCEVLASES